jgi:hypothetical protein
MQKQTLARGAEVIPGVIEAVAACRRRGLKIGSTTGYTRALMEVVVPIAARGGFEPDVVICTNGFRSPVPLEADFGCGRRITALEGLGCGKRRSRSRVGSTPGVFRQFVALPCGSTPPNACVWKRPGRGSMLVAYP